MDRRLHWDGCCNVRDLGGLRTREDRTTRWGAVVRSDHPAKLTTAGWDALRAYGIRTIVSLVTDGLGDDEFAKVPCPAGLTTVKVALEDLSDRAFAERWVDTDLWCTPLYYRNALERWPQRHAEALASVAGAEPGGVLIHCGRGHDRTGIIALLLLALVRVAPETIVDDWELSGPNMSPGDQAALAHLLDRENTSAEAALLELLAWLDIDDYLRSGGLRDADLTSLRNRLLV